MLVRTRERLERAGFHDVDLWHHALPLGDDTVERLAWQARLITMRASSSTSRRTTCSCVNARLRGPGGHLLVSFPNRRAVYWRLQRALNRTPLFAGSMSRYQKT
jgi:hypothetical protein